MAAEGRKHVEKSGALYGWSDNDADRVAQRATNLAKNRVSNINALPGASSNAYEGPPAMSSPRKGGADVSYKLRNGS